MKKILFICPYPKNTVPAQRLKYEQYISIFEKNNFSCTIESFFNSREYGIIHKKGFFFSKVIAVLSGYVRRILLLFNLKKYDLIYIFLNVTPLGGNLFEKIFCKLSSKIIYDIDDLVYLNKYSEQNKLAKYFRFSKKYYYLMESSDHVITCTSYLNNFVKKYNKNTTNISSTINTKKYIPIKKNKNYNNVVLGWTGSFSTLPYLHLIDDVINEIQQSYVCPIHIIGSTKEKFKFVNYKSFKWNSKSEVRILNTIDIGLYPLPNEEWVKGKSGLKAIQFMALGIPVVATDTEINRKVIINNKTGFLVKSNKGWIKKIKLLIKNKKLRYKMGLNGIKHVEKNFSIDVNKEKYLKILNKLTSE